MCLCFCLNKKTYKVMRCIPLNAFVLIIGMLVMCENVLYLLFPYFIIPSAIMTLALPLYICSGRSSNLRHCLWVLYLVMALIQLVVTSVIFVLKMWFPQDEDCV